MDIKSRYENYKRQSLEREVEDAERPLTSLVNILKSSYYNGLRKKSTTNIY